MVPLMLLGLHNEYRSGINGWLPKDRFGTINEVLRPIDATNATSAQPPTTVPDQQVESLPPDAMTAPAHSRTPHEPKLDMTNKEYERYLKTSLKNTETITSELPVKATIVESMLGLMCLQPPHTTAHDAIPLLQGYTRKGCPVKCGADWSREHIELMLNRGPHRSALAKKAVSQLLQETID